MCGCSFLDVAFLDTERFNIMVNILSSFQYLLSVLARPGSQLGKSRLKSWLPKQDMKSLAAQSASTVNWAYYRHWGHYRQDTIIDTETLVSSNIISLICWSRPPYLQDEQLENSYFSSQAAVLTGVWQNYTITDRWMDRWQTNTFIELNTIDLITRVKTWNLKVEPSI